MKKCFTLIILILEIGIIKSQNTWTQMSNVGGVTRQAATGFGIGHKGYICLGFNAATTNLLDDLWEYDPSINTWTQKANYGGTARANPSCFVIGNYAYVGLGTDAYPVFNYRTDFWKYDPSTNSWSQIANFGGTARYDAVGFAIGNKGFIGTGYDPNTLNDFWEYNSITDSWVQKANVPGGPRQGAVGFALGAYGYIGTGEYSGSAYSDFYKYDTTANIWDTITNFPTIEFGLVHFEIGNKAYLGTGTTTYPAFTLLNHFWEFDPSNNTWTPVAAMGGTPRLNTLAFAIDSFGYCGTGAYNGYSSDLNDFWKYAPLDNGIDDPSLSAFNLSVYPNPASSQFKINYASLQNVTVEIKISDISGKIILSENQKQYKGVNEFSFDLTDKMKGIYFIELISNNNIQTKKIVLE